MAESSLLDSYVALLTLRGIRRYIVRSHAMMMTVFFGLVYAIVALSASGMLVLIRLGGGYSVYLTSAPGTGPGFLVLAPWGILALPLFGVVAMAVVAVGVALGMSVAVLLALGAVRRRGPASGGPVTIGSLTGLTPAMITLLALGACCSTTAAATAGVGVIAQLTGSSTGALLANNWFLSVFQLAVVWIALLAQEALLRVYGGLYGRPAELPGVARTLAPPSIDRKVIAGTVLRAGLMIGGLTWILAVFAGWATSGSTAGSAALWVDWTLLHFLPGGTAIAVALFPAAARRLFVELGRSRAVGTVRVALGIAGTALLVGAPPPLAGWGLEGWGNEVAGWAGVPASLGGIGPLAPVGWALAFRWGVELGLVGGFAAALAVRPSAALRAVLWSGGGATAPGPTYRPDPEPSPFPT